MTVAALLDYGFSFETIKKELSKIKIRGYFLKKRSVRRGHAQALQWEVCVTGNKNYSYNEIVRLVQSSRLSIPVKGNILKIYKVLRDAEIKVHGHRHQNIKFHQLGEIDTILDIASICISLEKLGVERVVYGTIPVSTQVAPATMELLLGKNIYFNSLTYENVTPTGMAFLCALGKQVQADLKHVFQIGRCGYGAGSYDALGVSNVLRVTELKTKELFQTDEIYLLEANIDDMNPQFFEYVFDKLFQAGALDVFVQNVYMKKTRPGFLLTVLSNEENLGKISHLVLKETTTSGVRFYLAQRWKLDRKIAQIHLRGCQVRVKLIRDVCGEWRPVPEFKDCRALAEKTQIPISKIYNEVQKKAESKWRSQD